MVVIKAELTFKKEFNVNDIENNVKDYISNELNNSLFITYYPDTPYIKDNDNIQVIFLFKTHINGTNSKIKRYIENKLKTKFDKQLYSQDIQINITDYEK